MSRTFFSTLLVGTLALAGCGGGSSDRNNTEPGAVTVLLGDGPLEGVLEVNIDIEEVILIGESGQQSLTTNDVGTINLLDLRNVTRLIADTEVPAGTYSKIRLLINSLEIVPAEGDGAPEDAQLPANGKIDLNPQGAFEISPGEELVVQIDIDLHRSVHIVETGNSQYRFRPVVFIDVLDQTDNLRLTRLVGELNEDGNNVESDADLCPIEALDESPCIDVDIPGDTLILGVDGSPLADLLPADANVFGKYDVPLTGDPIFVASIIVVGDDTAVSQINGTVASPVLDDAFDLSPPASPDLVNIGILADARLLDGAGDPIATTDINVGNLAEAWAQSALVGADPFPAFLVQVRENDEEDSAMGTLTLVDGDELTLNDGMADLCVLVGASTAIQIVSGFDMDAETMPGTLADLEVLVGDAINVEAFGTVVDGCLNASVVVAETP